MRKQPKNNGFTQQFPDFRVNLQRIWWCSSQRSRFMRVGQALEPPFTTHACWADTEAAVLHQHHTHVSCGLQDTHWALRRSCGNCWIKLLFLYVCAQKVSSSLYTVKAEPLESPGLFQLCLYPLSALWVMVMLQQGVKKLLDLIKTLFQRCSEVLGLLYDFRVSNSQQNFHFAWSIPLMF